MDSHLVAVEVCVKGCADQGMQADGLAFHKLGLKGLDAQPVQGRCTVEHDRVFPDDLGQDIPYFLLFALHHLLGALDGGGKASFFQLGINEGLEELKGHLLGQAALMQFQVRSYADD